ncbi:MAG: CPBP family intramembrane metalloprotease [Ruminococcaceae bacterium]|nr:CPBP family intramembrane metalloprotease [Oscillospiraceae bacterium]
MKKNNSQSAKPNDAPKKSRTVFIQPTSLVLATYILLLLSKIIDLTLINRENEYYSVVILQMMVFLLPGAIWCKFSGEKYVKNLRLRLFGANSIVLILASSFLMISGSLLLSFIFGGLDSLSQNFSLYDTFISRDNGTVPVRLYLLVAYAVLPAICEEFVFRGILCHEYERGGVTRAIVLSSLFFALLHFNFANLPVYLFSGIVLAMTLYATRSLFGAMLAHFLYNIFGLFGQPYMSTLYNITNSTKLFMFIVGFVFIASAAIFCGEASRLYKNHLYRGHSADYRQPLNDELPKIRDSYLDVIKAPSAIACLVVYIIALIISWI